MPPPPPAAPHVPRAAPHSASSSRCGAGIRRGAAAVSLRARPLHGTPPPEPGSSRRCARPLPTKCPREMGLASPGRRTGKGLPGAHSNGILSPGGGGREATSADTGAGVVGTTFCVPARRRPRRSLCARPRSQVELRSPGCAVHRDIKSASAACTRWTCTRWER